MIIRVYSVGSRICAVPKLIRISIMMRAGVQARAQLLGLSRHFKIEQVIVFDTSQERSRSLEKDGREFLDCEYLISAKPQDACECDILVTTTPSRRPVVKESWIGPRQCTPAK